VASFDAAPDVDWIFAACRMVDAAGQVVQESTFLDGSGQPHQFLSLEHEVRNELRVIVDRHRVECLLASGIYCGLQNSVIRTRVFERHRFWEDYRVVEDAQFLLRALVRGIRLAYLLDVHVLYRIHASNSSASAANLDRSRAREICEEKVRGLERLKAEVSLRAAEKRALNAGLAREYFWRLGYFCCWAGGDPGGALDAMSSGLRLRPWNVAMWKTYLACRIRRYAGRAPAVGSGTAHRSQA
jgi:hypothetical protein